MEQDPYRFFRIEAAELSEQLARGVLMLSQGTAGVRIDELLRAAHMLKGAARVVKHRALAESAHAIEELLSPLRDGSAISADGVVDALLSASDGIAKLVRAMSPAPVSSPPPGRVPAEPHEEEVRPVATDTDELERFVEGVSEVSVQIRTVRTSVAELDRMRHLAALLVSQIDSVAPREGQRTHVLSKARSIAAELEHLAENVERSVASGLEQTERELSEVQASAERLRLVPCRLMEEALARTAHDVARELGKRVAFSMHGADVRLDAQALTRVRGALVQAVRNAVAHGIELPEERARFGKAPKGTVEVNVVRRGKLVVFSCSDDGRGVDLDALRRAAERSGALSPGQLVDRDALIALLFKGGLTTARSVTEASGRGIGLDVVRDVAARLGGRVSLSTEEAAGTTLELSVPVVLSSMEALLVQAGGVIAAIPLDAVEGAVRLTDSDLTRDDRQTTIVRDGRSIPLVPLERPLLGTPAAAPVRGKAFAAVVVRGTSSVAACAVDRLVGIGNVVVRALPALAPSHPVVLGASLDVAGAPQLVVDPDALVAAIHAPGDVVSEQDAAPALPVLVVDDSLTTRMLERSILESAGYEVELAASAEEALEKTAQRRYGLFLVDVEMPGMSGFDFVERTRQQAVPAILVSSRSSPEDLDRGREVGASAYIVKADFDQRMLLDTIRGLVSA